MRRSCGRVDRWLNLERGDGTPPELLLLRVVKDDADGMTHSGAQAADAVPEVHAVIALRPSHRSVMNREGHRITLSKRDDLGATLHARPLFGQDKLPAGEISTGLREKDRDLDRKEEIAIEILMQTVEVTGHVLQQQRRRPRLAGVMALRQKRGVLDGIPLVDSHAIVPLVGDGHKARI